MPPIFRIEDIPRDPPANPLAVVVIVRAFESAGLSADAAARVCDGRPPAKWTRRDTVALVNLIRDGREAMRAAVEAAP